jgi:hypothetical protein
VHRRALLKWQRGYRSTQQELFKCFDCVAIAKANAVVRTRLYMSVCLIRVCCNINVLMKDKIYFEFHLPRTFFNTPQSPRAILVRLRRHLTSPDSRICHILHLAARAPAGTTASIIDPGGQLP